MAHRPEAPRHDGPAGGAEARSERAGPPGGPLVATALAMAGFAANSLVCRAALAPHLAGPAGFTAIRLASGAFVLALLVRFARGRRPGGGSWLSAAALFAYAAAFSLAYVRIPAAAGALLLFTAVQVTMVVWALRRGDRPSRRQGFGLAVALGGLIALTLPGARAPDPAGAALMAAAGFAWGVYSLRGGAGTDPLSTTADNFLRSLPFAAAFLLARAEGVPSAAGAALAIASGAFASALSYALWYAVVPALGRTRAAVVQLSVPVLAAAGAVAFLGERLAPRLLAAGAVILGGVAVATFRPARSAPGAGTREGDPAVPDPPRCGRP